MSHPVVIEDRFPSGHFGENETILVGRIHEFPSSILRVIIEWNLEMIICITSMVATIIQYDDIRICNKTTPYSSVCHPPGLFSSIYRYDGMGCTFRVLCNDEGYTMLQNFPPNHLDEETFYQVEKRDPILSKIVLRLSFPLLCSCGVSRVYPPPSLECHTVFL